MDVKIDQTTIKQMALGHVHKYPSRVVSLDFSNEGDTWVAATADGNVFFYNVFDGEEKSHYMLKEFGVDSIKYWSIHDNQYLRSFQGHTDRVVALQMNPVNDTFVSAGLDYSLRCWDLRDPKCGALLRYKSATPHLPCVAFDPAGLLFAMSSASGVIKMFDTTNLSAGPFASFQLPEDTMGDISAIKFSHSGTQMLVSSLQGSLALVDAFNGKTERIISGFKNEHRSILEPSFSPDGKFVFSGAENGSIHCWSAIDGAEVAHWEGVHPGPVQCLAWNPVNLTFASACSNLGLWVRNEPTDAMDIS